MTDRLQRTVCRVKVCPVLAHLSTVPRPVRSLVGDIQRSAGTKIPSLFGFLVGDQSEKLIGLPSPRRRPSS
jgi:hypothetical protein